MCLTRSGVVSSRTLHGARVHAAWSRRRWSHRLQPSPGQAACSGAPSIRKLPPTVLWLMSSATKSSRSHSTAAPPPRAARSCAPLARRRLCARGDSALDYGDGEVSNGDNSGKSAIETMTRRWGVIGSGGQRRWSGILPDGARGILAPCAQRGRRAVLLAAGCGQHRQAGSLTHAG